MLQCELTDRPADFEELVPFLKTIITPPSALSLFKSLKRLPGWKFTQAADSESDSVLGRNMDMEDIELQEKKTNGDYGATCVSVLSDLPNYSEINYI